MNRRAFLSGLIVAPAVIAVERLMPIKPYLPIIYADGIRDDYAGLTALLNGEGVDIRAPRLFHHHPTHTDLGFTSVNNTFALSKPLVVPKSDGWRRDSFVGASFMKHPRFAAGDEPALLFEPGETAVTFLGAYVENTRWSGWHF